MKRDENETLCWIMRWGWMTWKWSLAFINNDDKKLYNLNIYLHKKINKWKTNLPTQPTVFLVCPCNIPWNGNQKQIKGNFSISNQVFWNLLLTDFNMHWLDYELQTIIYTDRSLSARINLLACLSLPPCPLLLLFLLSSLLLLFFLILLLQTSENSSNFIK